MQMNTTDHSRELENPLPPERCLDVLIGRIKTTAQETRGNDMPL